MRITVRLISSVPGVVETTARVDGSTLYVNEVAYPFSGLSDGDEGHVGKPFALPVTCEGGIPHATIEWLFDSTTAEERQSTTEPSGIFGDGAVPDPVKRKPVKQTEGTL